VSLPNGVGVVIVSHGHCSRLPALIDSLEAQIVPGDEVVVVENAEHGSPPSLALAALAARIKVIFPGRNDGFGAACHVGAAETTAPLLLMLNPDCVLEPECLARLRTAAADRPDWAAWQPAVMQSDGRINSVGGVVHFTGVSWAGGCGRAATALPAGPAPVAFTSGAATMIRRSAWERHSGYVPEYFLYHEDVDLGLRLWLAGEAVGIVPAAQVRHDYAFDHGQQKWFWLERNRWRTVLAVFPGRLLALLAPALVAAELLIHLVALRDGWLGAKLRADLYGVLDLRSTLARRRLVQAGARTSSTSFATHLQASTADVEHLPSGVTALARIVNAYWTAVTWLLRRARC
jgi:N-acetylglucosaminyl-diphospho-decaprenol L-rhamnosyltransferase